MTAAAAGAESVAVARPPPHAPASATGALVELSSDFPASADLVFPGDVVVLPPAPADTPSILRLSMRSDAARDLLDQMLGLGYHLRRAAATGPRAAGVQQFYVRGGPGGPARLRCAGSLTVLRGAEGRYPLAPTGAVRLEREASWSGDVESGDDVWLEAGACIHGAARTPGVLTLDKGSHVEGALQVGRVRFRSGESPDPSFPVPLPRQPDPDPQQRPVQETRTPRPRIDDGDAGPASLEAQSGNAAFASAAPLGKLEAFDGLPPLPGRFRVVARVAPAADSDERPKPVRAHQVPGRLLEVEVVGSSRRGWDLVLQPGTVSQRRVHCSAAEARRDPLLAHLTSIVPRVTTLRFVYGDGVRGVRASADSLRWLIVLFGKILRLESRLDRLEEMRILTGGEQARSLPPRTVRRERRRRAKASSVRKRVASARRRVQPARKRAKPARKARAGHKGKAGRARSRRRGVRARAR